MHASVIIANKRTHTCACVRVSTYNREVSTLGESYEARQHLKHVQSHMDTTRAYMLSHGYIETQNVLSRTQTLGEREIEGRIRYREKHTTDHKFSLASGDLKAHEGSDNVWKFRMEASPPGQNLCQSSPFVAQALLHTHAYVRYLTRKLKSRAKEEICPLMPLRSCTQEPICVTP